MQTTLPCHRYFALQDLRALRHGSKIELETLSNILDALQSPQFRSFLLPVGGSYIQPTTQTIQRVELESLPFQKLVIEYTNWPNFDPNGTGWSPRSTILVIHAADDYDKSCLWGIWQVPIDGTLRWVADRIGVIFSGDSKIMVNSLGRVRLSNAMAALTSKQIMESDEISQRMRRYLDPLRVLAHFQLVYQHENVTLRRFFADPEKSRLIGQETPTEYYGLMCNAHPAPFEWLPESGMTLSA